MKLFITGLAKNILVRNICTLRDGSLVCLVVNYFILFIYSLLSDLFSDLVVTTLSIILNHSFCGKRRSCIMTNC